MPVLRAHSPIRHHGIEDAVVQLENRALDGRTDGDIVTRLLKNFLLESEGDGLIIYT